MRYQRRVLFWPIEQMVLSSLDLSAGENYFHHLQAPLGLARTFIDDEKIGTWFRDVDCGDDGLTTALRNLIRTEMPAIMAAFKFNLWPGQLRITSTHSNLCKIIIDHFAISQFNKLLIKFELVIRKGCVPTLGQEFKDEKNRPWSSSVCSEAVFD